MSFLWFSCPEGLKSVVVFCKVRVCKMISKAKVCMDQRREGVDSMLGAFRFIHYYAR